MALGRMISEHACSYLDLLLYLWENIAWAETLILIKVKKNYKITFSVESKGKRAFKDTEQLFTFGYTAVFQLLHSESLLTTHIYK